MTDIVMPGDITDILSRVTTLLRGWELLGLYYDAEEKLLVFTFETTKTSNQRHLTFVLPSVDGYSDCLGILLTEYKDEDDTEGTELLNESVDIPSQILEIVNFWLANKAIVIGGGTLKEAES